MKIINGPKWLNVANMMRSVKVAPLTVSDNMIADNYLLALLMTACKPGDFLIYLDASIEQQLFADLNIGPKYDGLKSQFLCTDLEEGISRMITPYEVAAAEKMQAEEKAEEEQAEMASYKEKYEEIKWQFDDIKTQFDALNEENNNLRKAYTEEKDNVSELRTALKSATEKIESMRDEFNGVCKKFGLTRKCTEGEDPEWSQDLMKVIEYTELKKQAEELKDALITANDLVASQKSELEAKTHDYQQLKLEFENYEKSWNLIHDDLMEVQKQFGIHKDDDGKWQMIQDEKISR